MRTSRYQFIEVEVEGTIFEVEFEYSPDSDCGMGSPYESGCSWQSINTYPDPEDFDVDPNTVIEEARKHL